ncbi:hypothetical protein Y032_0413g990, partial [Ancylostoma ceylanicum]
MDLLRLVHNSSLCNKLRKTSVSKAGPERVKFVIPDVAETYAKIGDCLERMARVEPDKVLARTEVRASDGMHKLKK